MSVATEKCYKKETGRKLPQEGGKPAAGNLPPRCTVVVVIVIVVLVFVPAGRVGLCCPEPARVSEHLNGSRAGTASGTR